MRSNWQLPRTSVGRTPCLLHPGFLYQNQPGSFSGTYGKVAAVNPGTREVFIVATRQCLTVGTYVAGCVQLTGAPAPGTDVKIRQAIFSCNGPYWGGVTNVDTALPWTMLAQQTSGVLISAARSAYLNSTSARGLRCSLSTPVYIEPQPLWVVTAYEALYTADTDHTGLGNMAEIIGWPHQLGGTSGGFHRNVYFGTIKTDIESATLFTSIEQQAASSWTIASTAGSMSISCNGGAKVLAASMLQSAPWQLLCL